MQITKKQAQTTSTYAIAKYTRVFSSSNITASERRKTIYFFNCTSGILLAIVARLSLSLFFKQKGHRPDNLFSNMRKVPAKTSKSRKIRIVAGRRFWRFLLVNQLPLSIMALHAQYRAIAALIGHFQKYHNKR